MHGQAFFDVERSYLDYVNISEEEYDNLFTNNIL
jgi:hypothetical protein